MKSFTLIIAIFYFEILAKQSLKSTNKFVNKKKPPFSNSHFLWTKNLIYIQTRTSVRSLIIGLSLEKVPYPAIQIIKHELKI